MILGGRMKIAFILSHARIAPSNGIVSQALTWKKGLELLGNRVFLINMWDGNDWTGFDVIQYFGFSNYMRDHISGVSKMNKNIVVAPILDPDYSITRLKLYASFGSKRLNLTNQYHSFSCVKKQIRGVLARSEFEKKYLEQGFGFETRTCSVVPLSFNTIPFDESVKKEPFCFHVSLLGDQRKNVKRLIDAAIKYDFQLVLGGTLRDEKEREMVSSWIGGNRNVDLAGYLTHEELFDLYSRAKVFALPSTNEGVGIVGLEAASMHCDIVMTNVGGPKEYYNGMAKMVDPYNIDEIGTGVRFFLDGNTSQPKLASHVRETYSLDAISKRLLSIYENL